MTSNPLTPNQSREIILEVLLPILKSQPSTTGQASSGFNLALFWFLTHPRKKKRKPSLKDPDYVRKILRGLDMARVAARISTGRKPRIS